jgi:outer membrane protein assembly factor BamB
VQYPGGLAARYRWASSTDGTDFFGVSETGGRLTDLASVDSADRLCRAELRVEGPSGSWTARLASPIFDEPAGALWDSPQLLLVTYGFVLYAFAARTGELAWSHRSATPIVALLTSARLAHVLLQSEIETIALRDDGSVAWRIGHSDVVAEARLVAGRLDLTTYGGSHVILDAHTGLAA